jgi:hypothetical protein
MEPHWSKYRGMKYLESSITDDGRCEEEIKIRIPMAKEAFWQHKQLLRGNLKL